MKIKTSPTLKRQKTRSNLWPMETQLFFEAKKRNVEKHTPRRLRLIPSLKLYTVKSRWRCLADDISFWVPPPLFAVRSRFLLQGVYEFGLQDVEEAFVGWYLNLTRMVCLFWTSIHIPHYKWVELWRFTIYHWSNKKISRSCRVYIYLSHKSHSGILGKQISYMLKLTSPSWKWMPWETISFHFGPFYEGLFVSKICQFQKSIKKLALWWPAQALSFWRLLKAYPPWN